MSEEKHNRKATNFRLSQKTRDELADLSSEDCLDKSWRAVAEQAIHELWARLLGKRDGERG